MMRIFPVLGSFASIIYCMEITKWKPTEVDLEVMEVVWRQVKVNAKNEEETNSQNAVSERCFKK